jgi:hypothetical protein
VVNTLAKRGSQHRLLPKVGTPPLSAHVVTRLSGLKLVWTEILHGLGEYKYGILESVSSKPTPKGRSERNYGRQTMPNLARVPT